MSVEVRLIQPEEVGSWIHSVSVPFLDPTNTEDRRKAWDDHWRPHVEVGRTWAADDRGRFVGNACVFTRTVTLPAPPDAACPVVALAAISAVGVHPTHRRRGILRRFMGGMLADARERGEAVAGLLASESSIYGRFGFGAATQAAEYTLDARHATLSVPPREIELDLLHPSEAAKVLPAIFERACARQPGQVDRNEATWAQIFEDDPEDRAGASAASYAACAGGYVRFRTEEIVDRHHNWGRAKVRDLVAETAEIEAALWRFVLEIDLVREVVAFPRPVDEPIRHRLVDPRQLRTNAVIDFLWLRILDTPAALTARGYLRGGTLVLDVRPPGAVPSDIAGVDGADPAAGRWVLDAGTEGSTCRPAAPGERTDLVLGVAELSALLAGGTRASVLAAAGRLDEETTGAIDRADALFAGRPAPFSLTGF